MVRRWHGREFKLEAVRLVKGGQSMAATAKILGIAEQTLHNWIKADRQGRLTGPGTDLPGFFGPIVPGKMALRRKRGLEALLS